MASPAPLIDPYNVEDAVTRQAAAKPPCFAIFGHKNANTAEVARRIAHAWRCELLSPAHVVALAIAEVAEHEKKKKKGEDEDKGAGEDEEEQAAEEEEEEEGQEAADEDAEEPEEAEGGDEENEEEEDGEKPKFADPAAEQPPRTFGVPTQTAIQVRELALEGKEISEELVLALMEERMRSDAVRFRGYILEGLVSGPQASARMEALKAWPVAPEYIISVDMSESDIASRAKTQRIDPSTGRLFWGTETLPPVAPAVVPPSSEASPEVEGQDPIDPFDGEDEERPAPPPEPTLPTVLPFKPIDVKASKRLLQRPEDMLSEDSDAAVITAAAQKLAQAYTASFSPFHRIRVNGNQPLHLVVNDVLAHLFSRNLLPAVEPMALTFEEDEGSFSTDMDLFEALSRIGIEGSVTEEDENIRRPDWVPGIFGAYCPVTYLDLGILQRGKAAHSVGYRGRLYLCASEPARQKFLECPSRFLAQRAALPCFAVAFGAPEALESVVQHLSKSYGVRLLDGETLGPQGTPEERVANLFGAQQSGNWILRNFPTNAEELHIMETRGITPNLVLRVQNTTLQDFDEVFASNLEDRKIALLEVPAITAAAAAGATTTAAESSGASPTTAADTDMFVRKIDIILQNAVAVAAGPAEHDIEGDLLNNEEEGEADEDAKFNKDTQYGVTGRFCPVALATRNVLFPGLPDTAVRYKNRYYHFSSDEARDKFVASPLDFIQLDRPISAPPFRAIFVGPTGAGKTVHARRISRRHRLLHISFPDRLRDLAHTKGYAHADAIKEHLTSPEETPLDSAIAMEIVKEFWDPESVFGKSGFLLEGFPRTEDEAKALCDAGLYPDLYLHLTCSPHVAERRTLTRKLRDYQAHRTRVQELRQRKDEARKAKAKAHKEAWEKEQATKRAEFIAAKQTKREAEGDGYQSDGEEFSPEEYTPEEEGGDEETSAGADAEDDGEEQMQTDDEATSRLKEEISALHDTSSSAAQSIADACKNDLRVAIAEVNGDLSEDGVRAVLSKHLDPYFNARQSKLFGSCYFVPLPRAEFLLNNGYAHQSHLGVWCPSLLLQKKACAPLDKARFPVVFGETVYFCSSQEARRSFAADPLLHLAQGRPPVSAPLALAVVGPPKSGKSLAAQRLAAQFGVEVVTVESAWQGLQTREPHSELLRRINAQLREGTALSDQLCAELLGNALLAPRSRTRGYVLDGFPSSKQQLEIFLKSAETPLQRVFELELSEAASCGRSLKDHQEHSVASATAEAVDSLPAHDSEEIVQIRIKAYTEEARRMREWCSAELRNWVSIDASKSKWWVGTRITEEAARALVQQERHLDALLSNSPAPVCGLPIPKSVLHARLGPTALFSPVSLADKREFVQTPLESLEHTLEYKGRFFKLASAEEAQQFCTQPQKYAAVELPAAVPRRRAPADLKAAFPRQLEFGGFCPVTYVQGDQRYQSLKQGENELLAEYDSAFFTFANQESLDLFLRSPIAFHNIPLPKKLPPKLQPIAVGNLPMLGYMEQTASNMVTKAITAVGLKRPKYPHLTAQQSAEVYVGMYLKAHNPKSTDYARSVWRAKMRKFEEACDALKYLGTNMSRSEHDSRPLDFDHKMAKFFALTR